MRFDLKVPYAEKDAAKKLGARWDAALKVWYVANNADLTPFAKWNPAPHTPVTPVPPSAISVTHRPAAKAPVNASEGLLVVGSRYVALPRICECLPWEDCAKCRTD